MGHGNSSSRSLSMSFPVGLCEAGWRRLKGPLFWAFWYMPRSRSMNALVVGGASGTSCVGSTSLSFSTTPLVASPLFDGRSVINAACDKVA